ncbi:dysbindin [Trichomycterus rosablanca]|uniref:dysbindin n=1 Tax=Trichomycterus rosablanca TaxID=2290929 RepID=UPI002F35BC6E
MSSKGTSLHHKRLPSETDLALRVPEMDTAQQLKLRERQRFFEEVFQHDVDVYYSSAHLQIDYMRAPMSSISSMEVNVDMLEQMELLDISDPEALDVFLASTEDDDTTLSQLPADGCSDNDALNEEISLRVPDPCEYKSRISSTSSTSTNDSQGEDGAETPVVQSEDEDDADLLVMRTPPASDGESQTELGL